MSFIGKKHSEETKKKMSEAHKGEKHYNWGKKASAETRRKMSEAHKGRKHTEESKKKMSEIAKSKGVGKWMKGRERTEETRKKMSLIMSGENNPNFGKRREKSPTWKGGQKVRSDGYVYILKREHPFAGKYGYVALHRLIAESVLGRFLKPNEEVHHINGNPSDNRKCNLLICTHDYHSWLHRRIQNLGATL